MQSTHPNKINQEMNLKKNIWAELERDYQVVEFEMLF